MHDTTNSSGARYYHGGVGGLRVGDLVLPPSETGAPCASDYGAAGVHRRDRVYVATDPQAALLWGALRPGPLGCAYRVEPIGELEPDPDCSEPGLSFTCPRARVLAVRAITPKERRRVRKALGVPR